MAILNTNIEKHIFTDGKYYIDLMKTGKYRLTHMAQHIFTSENLEQILKIYQKKVYA